MGELSKQSAAQFKNSLEYASMSRMYQMFFMSAPISTQYSVVLTDTKLFKICLLRALLLSFWKLEYETVRFILILLISCYLVMVELNYQ